MLPLAEAFDEMSRQRDPKQKASDLVATKLGVARSTQEVVGSATEMLPSGDALASTNRGMAPTERAVAPDLMATGDSALTVDAGGVDDPGYESQGPGWFREGQLVNQYEIIREIGAGGMGRVYLARDTVLGRRVALKFLISNSAQFNQRFLIEARTTAQLHHENIVILHEANEFQSAPYMVLEYLEGTTLKDHAHELVLSPSRVVEIMVPVVRALARAHQLDIIHRDLKPDNVFILESGQVKVLDFGIAKLFTDREEAIVAAAETALPEADISRIGDLRLTADGAILGTMPFMAPEQWGYGKICHATDVWAVGILLYKLLTGHHPLEPLSPQSLQVAAASTNEPVPSIAERVPDLPSELIGIVDHCLRKKASERFQDAGELLVELEGLLPERRGRNLKDGENPYPGLVAFQEADAGRFFGRSRDVLRITKKLHEQPLVAIAGASGVGKSSLIRAGVVPRLKASGESWETFTIRPGRYPVSSLVNVLLPLTGSLTPTVDSEIAAHSELAERIRAEPGYVGTVLRSRARKYEGHVLLFVDQFEELYTLVSEPAERRAFTAALAAIADDSSSPLRVVVSMRSDFLDRAGEDELFLEELSHGLVFLQRPDREGLREALTHPVEMAGYSFENPSLVKDMLDSLSETQGALPLLQFSAARLWEERDRTRKLLTTESYMKMGGVAGTLASHANEVVEGLSTSQQKLVRSIFQRLVTPDGTRAIVDVSELRELGGDPDEVAKTITYLVKSRLLVTQSRVEAEGAATEIVHESLISKWPRLRGWLEEGHEDSLFLDQLRSAAKQWVNKGKPEGLLWRGEARHEAKRFMSRFKGELSSRESDFLADVMALHAKGVRRRRRALITSFALLVALVVAGAVGLVSIRAAEQEAVKAEQAALRNAVVAEEEAAKAKKAESVVREQYDLLIEKEEAKKRAESETLRGREVIKRTNEELQTALAHAKDHAQRAEDEAAKVAKANDSLKKAATLLERSAKKERDAKIALEKLVKAREKELAKLRAQGKKIKKTLD